MGVGNACLPLPHHPHSHLTSPLIFLFLTHPFLSTHPHPLYLPCNLGLEGDGQWWGWWVVEMEMLAFPFPSLPLPLPLLPCLALFLSMLRASGLTAWHTPACSSLSSPPKHASYICILFAFWPRCMPCLTMSSACRMVCDNISIKQNKNKTNFFSFSSLCLFLCKLSALTKTCLLSLFPHSLCSHTPLLHFLFISLSLPPLLFLSVSILFSLFLSLSLIKFPPLGGRGERTGQGRDRIFLVKKQQSSPVTSIYLHHVS